MNSVEMLSGLKVLVVEDDYMVATDLAVELEDYGAEVIGPAASVADALELIDVHGDQLDCASLDVNLQGERVFAVADALIARNVPFVFSTGYDSHVLPQEYRSIPRFEKPSESSKLLRLLVDRLDH